MEIFSMSSFTELSYDENGGEEEIIFFDVANLKESEVAERAMFLSGNKKGAPYLTSPKIGKPIKDN